MGIGGGPFPIPVELERIFNTVEKKSPRIKRIEINEKNKIENIMNEIFLERAQKVEETKDKIFMN